MDHPCHKCGHTVEDGKPFCSQCGAPQIRVTISAPVAEAFAGDGAAAEKIADSHPVLEGVSASSLPLGWSRNVRPCALGAIAAAVLTFLGLNPFVAALGAGLLSVILSHRSEPAMALRPGIGARLGAVSGLFLFGISTILETLAVVFLHKGAELRNQMMEKVQQASVRYPGPQVQPFLDFVKTPEGFAFMMAGSVLFGLAAFIALGSLGGAIGAAFLGRRNRL